MDYREICSEVEWCVGAFEFRRIETPPDEEEAEADEDE